MQTENTTVPVLVDAKVLTFPRIAYIVSLFPCWSETFIAEEVHQLIQQGGNVSIFSLKPHSEEQIQALSRKLLDRVTYPASLFALLIAQLATFMAMPRKYTRQFWMVMRGAGINPREIAKFLATFVIAIYFGRKMLKDGIGRIHAHWATYPATAAWTISELIGIPFSFTSHAHDLYRPDSLLSRKIKAAQFVVTISEYNQRMLKRIPESAAKIAVIHCGIDPDRFPPVEAKGAYGEKPRLISVGRLAEIKGFDVLIDACAILRDRGVEFECEIVGEGPLRSKLEKQVVGNQLQDRVRLSGFSSQDELRMKLRSSAVFVLACQEAKGNDRDGIPVALMEPMSMRVPVVSTYVSGVPELVENEKSGLLVTAGNARELAAAIERILSDSRLAERLAEQGRRTVIEDFNVVRNARRLMELFAQ